MGLKGGEKITDITLDRVFIGSCTNGRIEDLRAVAKVVAGRQVNANVSAMVVPGSGLVKEQAEAEGLDKIFKAAGFEWREPGCSMCLAMNADQLRPGERCASTSNRNFEGRQGGSAAPISSRRRWRRRRRSPAASSTSASFIESLGVPSAPTAPLPSGERVEVRDPPRKLCDFALASPGAPGRQLRAVTYPPRGRGDRV